MTVRVRAPALGRTSTVRGLVIPGAHCRPANEAQGAEAREAWLAVGAPTESPALRIWLGQIHREAVDLGVELEPAAVWWLLGFPIMVAHGGPPPIVAAVVEDGEG